MTMTSDPNDSDDDGGQYITQLPFCPCNHSVLIGVILFYRYAKWYREGDSLHLRYPSQEGGRDHTLEMAAETDICGAGLHRPWGLP